MQFITIVMKILIRDSLVEYCNDDNVCSVEGSKSNSFELQIPSCQQ